MKLICNKFVLVLLLIFSLPFFINTFENLDKLEYGETGKAIFEAMEKKGAVGLAWAENGFRQLTNSKKAVHTPEDLKEALLQFNIEAS